MKEYCDGNIFYVERKHNIGVDGVCKWCNEKEEPTEENGCTISGLGPITHTNRGFQIIEFTDRYGSACELQQSSLADFEPPGSSAVWLGTKNERMHIDIEQAKALCKALQAWIQTGSFEGA